MDQEKKDDKMYVLSNDIMTIEFEDGAVVDCIIDFIFPVNGIQYIALHPEEFEGDEDDCPIYFYRYSEDADENPILDMIENDEELDAVLDRAQELFDLENTSESDKSDAQRSVETILKRFTIQDSIESIVKAKGFSDCLCCISDEGVTLIVPKEQLTETAALVLDDAVTSHYNVSYENITLVGA